jgi:peptide/nickel transport system substrate-binding protein
MKRYSRREVLVYGVATTGGLLVLGACSAGGGDDGAAGSGAELPDIQGAELITDADRFPSRFSERPEFAEQVAAGRLPPVEERIGQDPLVLQPLEGTGEYGGTIRRAYLGPGDFQNANRFCAGPDNLLYWDRQRRTVLPNVARSYELSDDFTEMILHLRRGMRWSDGEPFTADDIIFWREDMSLDPDLSPAGSPSLKVAGRDVRVVKVDDYTVRYTAPEPHPLLPALLASFSDVGGQTASGKTGGGGFAPRHYLQQFHPAYTSEREASGLARDAGFGTWQEFFKDRNTWENNRDLPLVTPWIVTRPINDPPWEFFANPYSIWVDTDGNQLPYIGEISMSLVQSPDTLTTQAIAGQFDFQDRHLDVANLPVLLDNEDRSGFAVHRSPSEDMDCGIRINLAYDNDPVLGDLLRTVEFRRALALGIERDQINESFFVGTSTPSATMVPDYSPYFPGEEWRTRWATHDVEQANALLDEMGLTDRNGSGIRIRPDGQGPIRLECEATVAFADFPAIGQMVRRQWADIGIDMNVETVESNLLIERTLSNDLMLSIHQVGTDDVFLRSDAFLPTVTNNYPGMIGIPYAKWFTSGGRDGVEPPEELGLHEGMDLYRRGLEAPEDERIELGRELYRLHADMVWSIGLVGFGLSQYGIYLRNNDMRNVPGRVLNTLHQKTPTNTYPMTFYYA